MSLRSGRVGVNPEDVNPINGKIQVEVPVNVYTKTQADNKFETKTHAGNTYLTKTEAEALQPINLAVPVPLLDGSALTVESALQGLSKEKFNRAEQQMLGAKNLLPTIGETTTVNGITITKNADGSMTLNGTSTAEVNLDYVLNNVGMSILRGNFIASLGNDTISGMTINIYKSTSGMWQLDANHRVINDLVFTDAEHLSGKLRLYIGNNKTYDNAVIKPMLRLASDPDDAYVPYAMTNRDLTGAKLDVSVLKSITADASDFSAFKTAIANL